MYVTEKTRNRVSLGYPSSVSLRAYFMDSTRTATTDCIIHGSKEEYSKQLPSLDLKCTIESEAAALVLYRRIPPLELAANSAKRLFWITARPPPPPPTLMETSLADRLKDPGVLKWACRRRVTFLPTQPQSADNDDDDHAATVPVSTTGARVEEEEPEAEVAESRRSHDPKRKSPVWCVTLSSKKQHLEVTPSDSGDTKKQLVMNTIRSL
ncbi:hypothetical protein Tsubulata_029457 [Turnera subulata]|uniref:Uncharacterized protein n=1 Tax=Turnera subulata TaxID=218843 RepID=A0A9Q0GCP3_9ROSI|nr:hypothetical protein Tsubulata_029457 [Turnera subulata]